MSTQAPIELDQLSEQYEIIGELSGSGGSANGESGTRHGHHQGKIARTLLGLRKADNAPVLITVATEPEQDTNNALSHLAADTNLLATLRHRAMLPVLGGQWLGNTAFAVVSERPAWPSLGATIAREQLPYARVAAILREVNAAIEWSRDKGIVHRNVDAESVFVEPRSDRTLVKFGAAELPEHGTPGRAADAGTIARLAKLMIGDRDDAPKRLLAETESVLTSATERGATPDIHEYIALVAMADAVKRGEDHSAETAIALEQQRREFDAKIAAERAEHERAMEEQRKQMERKAQEQEKAHAERLKELERRQDEQEKQLADERKRIERQQLEHERELVRQRREMEKHHEHRLQELEKRHAEHEKQIASSKREVERQLQQQQRALEKERKQFEREMRRQRETLRKQQEALGVAAESSAAFAGTAGDAHDVEVEVPFTSDFRRVSDPDIVLADIPPTQEMPMVFADDAIPDTREHELPLAEAAYSSNVAMRPTQPMRAFDDAHDEIVDEPEDVHPDDVMPVALDAATIGAADASAGDAEADVPSSPDAEVHHDPVPSIWDRPQRSFRDRLPKWNTPLGAAILAVLLFVVLGATVAIVRNRHHAPVVASRTDSSAVDSAAGTVSAPFGYFAMPAADSLAKIRSDSLAADSAMKAQDARASEAAVAEASRRPRAETSDSTRVRGLDTLSTDSAATIARRSTAPPATDTSSDAAPVFTIQPETTATRVVPRDTATHRPVDTAKPAVRPDTTVKRDTTGRR